MTSALKAPGHTRKSQRRRQGRPPGADGAVTREAILEAALQAFADAGYDAMSVRELTRRLGVSHNLVHHHFGSKDELWRAAIDHGMRRNNQILALMEAPPASDDPIETGKQVIKRVAQLSARMPALPRIMARESAEGGERLDYIWEHYTAPGLEQGMRYFEEVLRDAGFNDFDMRSIVLLVTNGISSLFSQAPLARKFGGPEPFSPEAIERHADAIANVLIYGLLKRD